MLCPDILMAYFRVFWHQKLINGNEKITRVTIQGLNVNFSIFWVLIYLVINQNLKPKKRQNWGKNSRNVESIIYLIQLKSLMPSVICFQDDNCEYRRSFFYGMFMSNIIKLISANLQEGNKGTSEKLRYVRVSMNFTLIDVCASNGHSWHFYCHE